MEKKVQRQGCLAARRAIPNEKKRQKSAQIAAQLTRNEAVLRAKTVLSYLAAAEEVELSAFHRWAESAGKRVAYPVSGPGGEMTAAIPREESALVPGRFGIREPDTARSETVPPEDIDVVIVPCVGFDRRGGRLGHGGGYYDRYLPRCPHAHTILVAFTQQEVEQVAAESHDVTMDEIVIA